jgi:hypothetical protein
MAVSNHNSARWLEVRWLESAGGYCRYPPNREGWYVVRTCSCHRAEAVTVALKTEADAQRALRAMLEASRVLGT